MTIYEKLIFPKRLHYVPFWFMAGGILFVQQEIIARAFGETELLIVRLLISFYVSVVAIFVISLKNLFIKVGKKLENIIELPLPAEIWVQQRVTKLGTFGTLTVRVYILVLMLSFTATILWLGVPYNTIIPNLDFILSLQLFIITSAHMIYGEVELLKALKEIVRSPLKAPFYLSKHPAIMLLAKFYSQASFYALIIVCILALCVWYNPYSLTPMLVFWWLFTSTLPVMLFMWTFIQLHALMVRIKRESLKIINKQIQDSLQEIQDKSTPEEADKLAKFMSMQDMVEKMPEWPFSFQGIATFLVTFLFPMINIGLTVLGVFKNLR